MKYDEWVERTGRYDWGPERNAVWAAETNEVVHGLGAAGIHGDVLELAPGTGAWTERLARVATSVTALDASPAMIGECERRLKRTGLRDKVAFELVDLFDWRPSKTFDAVFTGFFLSHVPEDRMDGVIAAIAGALVPGGRFFYVDSKPEPSGTARDQRFPEADSMVMRRKLNDGREFDIVKICRSPKAMEQVFAAHGIRLEVHETANYFQWGLGTKD